MLAGSRQRLLREVFGGAGIVNQERQCCDQARPLSLAKNGKLQWWLCLEGVSRSNHLPYKRFRAPFG